MGGDVHAIFQPCYSGDWDTFSMALQTGCYPGFLSLGFWVDTYDRWHCEEESVLVREGLEG